MKPQDRLETQFKLTEQQMRSLERLSIRTVQDLLFHFPSRYGDVYTVKTIGDVTDGDTVTLYTQIKKIETGKTFRRKIPEATATLEDETGTAKARWFHQPYIAKKAPEGALVRISGEAKKSANGSVLFINPDIEAVSKAPHGVGSSLFGTDTLQFLQPVYPERKGITSKWIHHKIQTFIKKGVLDELTDPIPPEILDRFSLPTLKTALIWIHTPKREEDAYSARKRFAFQEVFFIQLQKHKERKEREALPSFVIKPDGKKVAEFINRFPFSPTAAQKKAMEEILSDMSTELPMSRLLEGDVGSGKTAVASVAAFSVVTTRPEGQGFGNLQVAYMVPTEILARQQFENFIQYFAHLGIQVGLLTSSGCRKFPSKVDPEQSTPISRAQLLKWVANGEVPILVGTHALIQRSVAFENLALVIIDEQHRFGVIQRQDLVRKDTTTPHLLSMTATPIPRTLALTIYGDLDLTVLDEMPHGRKQVKTEITPPGRRTETFKEIENELRAGRQMYVICPRITAPDPSQENALAAASVEEEVEYLSKEVFPNYEVAPLHGKMKAKEKDETMKRFTDGEIDVLVSTSVIEVGVNVPNATVIAIEGAERFGLAQLHQLRGRVLRSNHQAYCYIFSDSDNEKSLNRLKALKEARNGFELAEFDLAQRGSGELSGMRQWGVSDLAMEAIKNIKMVEAARSEARRLIEKDGDLKNYPDLKAHLAQNGKEVHFE